jgi:glycosyltransferase involved in cell wall biosynthesis
MLHPLGISVSRMKILFVTNVLPNSAGGGTPRRAAMHLQALRGIGDVTVVLPPTDGAILPDVAGMTILERDHALTDVRMWLHEGSRSRVKQPIHALRRLNLVDGRASAAEAKQFRAQLADDFDLVFAFRLRSAIWWESVFGQRAKATRVADLDDIESTVFARKIQHLGGPWWWQAKLRHELRWLRRTERRVAKQWDGVSLCSRLDADRFAQLTGVEPWIVPNAYHFGAVTPEPPAAPCSLLFVGTFGYFPNAEGVQWFVKAIWPQVRAALGDGVALSLVGLHPTPAILALNDHEGITVAGDVPSVAPYYENANIVIAPLQAGSGTRIKLIEAAALGRAIVTTSLGCEGLGFVDGVHAEIADNPVDFAHRVTALAQDPARRVRLAATARVHAMEAFSAQSVTATLQHNILALASAHGKAVEAA